MEEIDLKELFILFWNKRLVIILLVIIAMLVGVIYTVGFVTPVYKSSTSLVLATQQNITTTQQQESTITQVYRYVKYLYEICEKLYDYKPEKKSKNILSIIKTKIKQLKLKRTIKKVKQDYIKDNEMNIAKIDSTLFIDMDSLEQNFEYYKMFEGPMFKFIMDNNETIKKAVEETEKPIENEIVISSNNEDNKVEIIEVNRKEQIKRLKETKEQLIEREEMEKEIIVPTKTA